MQIFVQCGQLHAVEVSGVESVSHLKHLIESREGVSSSDLSLTTRAGRPLVDEQTLSEVLVEGSYVDATVGLLGGKVHGSLARAGKVKGQTPKVEKQEKKKKKTGRAKRRMQYNRRFVNVVASFGRRRGPNANQGAS